MIKYEHLPKLLRDMNVVIIDVIDSHDNKLYTIDGSTADEVIKQLDDMREILDGYGRVWIKACTKDQKSGNKRHYALWEVLLADKKVIPAVAAAVVQNNSNNAEFNALLERIKNLEKEKEIERAKERFKLKEKELEEKYAAKMKYGIDPGIMAMGAMLLGVPKDKIIETMQLGSMVSNYSQPGQQPPSLAGGPAASQTPPNLKLNVSAEEYTELIVAQMTEADKKIGSDNLLAILSWVNQQPEIFKNLMLLGNKIGNDKLMGMLTALNTNETALQMALTALTNQTQSNG